jgi:hypothetical protein
VSVPAVVWLAVGLASALILAALAIGLLRQLKRLVASLGEFQKAVEPVAAEMRAQAEAAQQHAEDLRRRSEAIREARSTGKRRRR